MIVHASFGFKEICGLGDLEASNEPRKAFSREKLRCVGTLVATNYLLNY